MMKKLLVLMLVLGMVSVTSVAQAALAWLQVDAATPAPAAGVAGVVQIDLVADFACTAFAMDVMLGTDTAGQVGAAVGVPYAMGWTPVVALHAGMPVVGGAPGYANNTAQALAIGNRAVLFDVSAGGIGAVPANTTIASFKYILQAGWAGTTLSLAPLGLAYTDDQPLPAVAGASFVADAVTSVGINV